MGVCAGAIADDDERSLVNFCRLEADETARTHRANLVPDWRWASFSAFVLDQGRFWIYRKKPRRIGWGEARQCYRNATALAMRSHYAGKGNYLYVEGYALRRDLPIPIRHAWCVTREGIVVDPTWDEPQGELAGDRVYLGVPFRIDYVIRTIAGTQVYGLIERWWDDYPLLTGRDPVEKAVQSWPK